ncbi:MAG: RNA-directed DNA polymerase [Parabacteroides sp.]|nr:RNA-directed DNA polymerase [Parabacteroides sp.]
MKRILYDPALPGNTLYTSISDMRNLELAHINASRGKGWYPEVIRVNKNPQEHFREIQKMLWNKTYKTARYRIFTKNENGKVRNIYSLPYYPDRIVQWAIIQVIGPILEKHFIYDCYSSIKGKGPLLCANRVYKAMHYHPDETKACLKIDIHHFYPSINQSILKTQYARLFKDKDLLWLINGIIDSLPENDGIPIGNYLSQYSGNLYLSGFDHFIKEKVGIKYYFRYMDDMVFLHDDYQFLKELFENIKFLLKEKLCLDIKPNYQLFYTCDRGIDFCGYVINHDYMKIRRRTRDKYIKKSKKYRYEKMNNHNRSSFYSYIGFLKHANTYNLQNKYSKPVMKNWLQRYGEIQTRRNNYQK